MAGHVTMSTRTGTDCAITAMRHVIISTRTGTESVTAAEDIIIIEAADPGRNTEFVIRRTSEDIMGAAMDKEEGIADIIDDTEGQRLRSGL